MRTYRFTAEGEKPVWARPDRISRWGVEDARLDFMRGDVRPRLGNLDYDQAYESEYERLQVRAGQTPDFKQKRPSGQS